MKKDEAVKALISKTSASVKKCFGEFEPPQITPRLLQPVLEPINEVVNEVKNKLRDGEPVIEQAVKNLSDSQLQSLQSIFERKVGVPTEQKLIQTAFAVLRELNFIEECVPCLEEMRLKLLATFVEAYGVEFNQQKEAERVFSNDKFVSLVSREMSFREGLRRASQQGEPSADQERQSESNCSIM